MIKASTFFMLFLRHCSPTYRWFRLGGSFGHKLAMCFLLAMVVDVMLCELPLEEGEAPARKGSTTSHNIEHVCARICLTSVSNWPTRFIVT